MRIGFNAGKRNWSRYFTHIHTHTHTHTHTQRNQVLKILLEYHQTARPCHATIIQMSENCYCSSKVRKHLKTGVAYHSCLLHHKGVCEVWPQKNLCLLEPIHEVLSSQNKKHPPNPLFRFHASTFIWNSCMIRQY